MAARKKTPESTQSSLFAFPKMVESQAPTFQASKEAHFAEREKRINPENGHGVADDFGGEDPPHAPAVVVERKLRVVPRAPEQPSEDVIVEPQSDGRFIVSTLRDHGTTCAAVVYTRSQLEMLLKRIPAALEVG